MHKSIKNKDQHHRNHSQWKDREAIREREAHQADHRQEKVINIIDD